MKRPNPLLMVVAVAALLVSESPAAAQGAPPRALAFLESIKGGEDVALRWPVAVAAASDEDIAIADAHGPRLLRFRRVGVSWQLDRAVEMRGVPVGLAWDGSRYVASLRQGRGLVAFEGAELVQRPLPLPRGVVPGALAAYTNGDLLVYDFAGRRVLRLSGDGAQTREVEIAGRVTALATRLTGGFYAAVAADASVLHFGANGSLEGTWTLPDHEQAPAWPVGLAAEPGGTVLVVDRHAGRLLVLDGGGRVAGLGSRRGWEPGLLLFPSGVVRLPGGLVLVADEGNGRAQVFRRTD
jgi:hypothetical protein